MIKKHVPSAPLRIAMGGRAVLTPLTRIGQYAAHLAQECKLIQEFVQGHPT